MSQDCGTQLKLDLWTRPRHNEHDDSRGTKIQKNKLNGKIVGHKRGYKTAETRWTNIFVGSFVDYRWWTRMNLKGKNTIIPHGQPISFDTTWCRLGPIFREVGVNSIDRVCDIGDPASNQTRIQSLQLLHHRSVGYQPRTTWLTSPRRLFLQANRRTQARKYKRAIWNCKYEWSEGKVGGSRTQFQRTNRHSGDDQEWGPWITVKGLVATVTTNQSQFHKEN